MRVDGSIKTVTAGVTSLDDKRQTGIFAKQVDNFRCDPADGLVKRAPLVYTGELDSVFNPNVDAIFPVTIQDALYWVLILPGWGPNGSHLISVYDELGVEQDVIDFPVPHYYFNTITGTDSVAHVVLEDTIYIANKNVEIEKISREEEWTKNSMLVIKQAPASFSKIEVTWTGSDNIQYTIEHPVPDFLEADVGTNTTAEAIQVLMSAAGSPDLIVVQGSTVGVIRVDREYANITATDGANDAVAATLNDETQDINNLPKYASHQSVVKIRPDKTSDRGQFWMRATAYIETDEDESYADKKLNEGLVEDAILTVGENSVSDLHAKGFQRLPADTLPGQFPPFGTLAPNTIQDELVNLLFSIGFLGESDGFFQVQVNEEIASPELFSHIHIVNRTSGNSLYESAMFHNQDDPTTFVGVSVFPHSDLIVGESYDVYYEQLEGFFGFLPEVEWNECADPSLLNHWNRDTLPHVLGVNSEGLFFTGPQQEMGLRNIHSPRSREAGDDETNPFPEFYSNTVNDLGKFQDRLVMLSGETVSMSQTDKQHAWFRDTVTQQLATDPIGMKASGANSTVFNHIVGHNNDALLFTRTSQYKLTGSQGMTSQNAAMPQTTNYDNSPTVKPISNGSDVFFPTAYSTVHAGVSRFQVDREADNQDIAVSISNHIQELLLGNITLLTASTTLNMIVCKAAAPNILYVYEYVDRRDNPQTAWARWVFHEDVNIRGIVFKDFTLEVIISDGEDLLHMLALRINRTASIFTPRVMYLDFYAAAVGVTTSFNTGNYPWDEQTIKLYQGTGSPNPEAEITNWSRTGSVVTVPNMGGGTVIYGYPYKASFIPARKWVRDPSGISQTASKLRITDWGFHAYADEINVDILNSPEPWPTQVFISNDPTNDQYNRISFKQRHDEADIEIWSDDPFSAEILQLEWRGTYYKTGRRF